MMLECCDVGCCDVGMLERRDFMILGLLLGALPGVVLGLPFQGCVWVHCSDGHCVFFLMLGHCCGAVAWSVAGCGSGAAIPGLLLGAVQGPSLGAVPGLSLGVLLGLSCWKAGML